MKRQTNRTQPRQQTAPRVCAWTEKLVLPTYEPAAPDKNPMFLEKRVYQGSNGKVYPLPFIDRIAEHPTPRAWHAVWIENDYLKVLVLPELGGRIHRFLDKTNGYDLIYHQPVIKPALVGLAGPWASGGIEFNWPQHHRPATFMPVDWEIEEHADGSKTIWCSDHDPMCRMKGMHGVCLHPDRAWVELKVRAHNRTPFTQTFLWWANVATRVHEAYQSFFPPDVYYVADHARRSMSEYPLAQGHYYGVNYGERGRSGIPAGEVPGQFVPPHCAKASGAPLREARHPLPDYAPNDLSFYANIPVPTSYMCMGSEEDFFGGYDYKAQAGIIHIASHHIAPGKKQWTWGNQEFGYAWDRNLTDADATGEYSPYIEIMSGVFTDNQPDFSFLQPGETKSWSQYWYPIQKIGPAQHANLDAAISLRRSGGRQLSASLRLGVSVTGAFLNACVELLPKPHTGRQPGGALPNAATLKPLARFTRNLMPGKPFLKEVKLPGGTKETDLLLRLSDSEGREIISYQPKPRAKGEVPTPATEPMPPTDMDSADELFVTGLHLDQYRHATRCPTLYWHEALRRDPLDSRCNNALGLWHLKRGEFTLAETHFRAAIERLTRRNANPADGEPYYHLGLCLRYQLNGWRPTTHRQGAGAMSRSGHRLSEMGNRLFSEAYAAYYKATWNQAWAGAAYQALAEMDCSRGDWDQAAEHIEKSCRTMALNQRAMNLRAIIVKRQGKPIAAEALARGNRAGDPLDWWARHLCGEKLTCDTQTLLDLALDLARAGLFREAIDLLGKGRKTPSPADPRSLGTTPLVHYYLGWLHDKLGDRQAALAALKQAAAAPPDYCFPARLEEIAILESAMAANPQDARAPYYLGNLLYDRRRHEEAIRLWERSARLDPSFSVIWRNLGIGFFNIRHDARKARRAYDQALRVNPSDARLLFERDQLWKRLGEQPGRRLRELEKHLDLVRQRDDVSLELCALYTQTGRPADALALVSSRRFQPWEGGEGGPLGQWVRSHLALGCAALRQGAAASAREHFAAALTAPCNLGEAKHPLANQSDIHYWLGCDCDALGDRKTSRWHWRAAAAFKGDFQDMSVRAFSELTYYSALSCERLGQRSKAKNLFLQLLTYAQKLRTTPARLDYFATSLPTLLLFDDDLPFRQETNALFLEAQARLGLSQRTRARALLTAVLRRDPNHARAADLATGLPSSGWHAPTQRKLNFPAGQRV